MSGKNNSGNTKKTNTEQKAEQGNKQQTDIMAFLQENKTLAALCGFCVLAFVLILVGVCALRAPVVAMCVLVILEAGIAVMLHGTELWLHGTMVLAQIIAGIIVGRIGVVILCALVYAAATYALRMSDMEPDKKIV